MDRPDWAVVEDRVPREIRRGLHGAVDGLTRNCAATFRDGSLESYANSPGVLGKVECPSAL